LVEGIGAGFAEVGDLGYRTRSLPFRDGLALMNFGFGSAGSLSPVAFGIAIDATGRCDLPFIACAGVARQTQHVLL